MKVPLSWVKLKNIYSQNNELTQNKSSRIHHQPALKGNEENNLAGLYWAWGNYRKAKAPNKSSKGGCQILQEKSLKQIKTLLNEVLEKTPPQSQKDLSRFNEVGICTLLGHIKVFEGDWVSGSLTPINIIQFGSLKRIEKKYEEAREFYCKALETLENNCKKPELNTNSALIKIQEKFLRKQIESLENKFNELKEWLAD